MATREGRLAWPVVAYATTGSNSGSKSRATQTHRELRKSFYSPFLQLIEKWITRLGAGRSQVQSCLPDSRKYGSTAVVDAPFTEQATGHGGRGSVPVVSESTIAARKT